MIKKLSCPNCGANLKKDAYYCDYCGAFFEKQRSPLEQAQLERFNSIPSKQAVKEEELYEDDHFVSTEEIENSRLNSILISYVNVKENNPFLGIFFIILFFFLFSISAVIEMPFFAIIMIIIFANSLNAQKEKKQELIKLYEKGAYEKAYHILLQLPNQEKISLIKQKIMLCCYRLNKKEEAITLINSLNSKPHIKDEHMKEVAQKLNAIYEPRIQQYM